MSQTTSGHVQVTRITTGFLSGNLLNETRGLDVAATIAAYAEALESAISAAYPTATVEVMSQDAEGTRPRPLRTHVYYASGDVQVEDGGLSCTDENVEAVEAIAQQVFEGGAWYVDAADAD